MPEIEFRVGAKSIDEVLAEFDRRKDGLADLANATQQLIEAILKEEKAEVHSVQARVKAREKLKLKYAKPDKDYRSLDDISDLVGLRIITYYSDRIDQVAAIVLREFEVCGEIDDKRKGKPDSFGYGAVHMDCVYLNSRRENAEYRRFGKTKFEIQISTILGHAWAEMHHPWYDELISPPDEARRFYRLAAVLELAEQEFLEIRKKRDERERVASVRVEANAPETPITPEALAALIEQSELISKLDLECLKIQGGQSLVKPEAAVLGVASAFAKAVGITTIQQLETRLVKME